MKKSIKNVRSIKPNTKYAKKLSNHILRECPDGFWVADLEGRFIDVNDSYLRASGYGREEFLSLSVSDIDADETREESEALIGKLADDKKGRFRTRHRRKDGSVFDVEISASLMTESKSRQFICFCRDISGQVDSEKKIKSLLREKELLLKEVHHRVKNDLSFIHSILNLQLHSGDDGDPAEKIRKAQRHIELAMQVYEELYLGSSVSGVLSTNLAERTVQPIRSRYIGTETAIDMDIEEFVIPARMGIAAGTILNEMITNSLKYGIVKNKSDSDIQVEMKKESSECMVMTVSDQGAGFPESVLSGEDTGFGMMIIGALAEQYNGKVTLANRNGAVISVSMNLSGS